MAYKHREKLYQEVFWVDKQRDKKEEYINA